MVRGWASYVACLLLMFGSMFGMDLELEHPSPEIEKPLSHGGPVSQSSIQGMQILQRRGSLPDRRNIVLALREFYSHHSSPDGTPRGIARSVPVIAALQESPVGTPHTNQSTPSGIVLNNFLDTLSVIDIKKTTDLADGWQERKKNAFKTSLFSNSNIEDTEFNGADLDRFKVGTIVYRVHPINKQCKVMSIDIQESILNEGVVIDARGEAIEELRAFLAQEVQKEANENGWSVENSTKE